MMRVIRAVGYAQSETAIALDPRLLTLAPSEVETPAAVFDRRPVCFA